MGATFSDIDGSSNDIVMGCYGLGITRLMGTIVEICHDSKGIIWPESVAPYQVCLISLNKNIEAEKIYNDLQKADIEVLYDDREDTTAGEKFADADLIGCPIQIIVSEKSLSSGGVEIRRRSEKESRVIKKEQILDNVK